MWIYEPRRHKTAHHGHHRRIYIGPRAQGVLAPFLFRDPEAHCFCPIEAVREWRERRHEGRLTPLSCGNTPGSNQSENPRWMPGERYKTDTYRCAVVRACDRAFPPPEPLARREDEAKAQWQKRLTMKQEGELNKWRRAHRWHPHQLRHSAATELRKEFGIEAARIILGHHSTAVTDIYAEKDEREAIKAMMQVG